MDDPENPEPPVNDKLLIIFHSGIAGDRVCERYVYCGALVAP